jgi:Putative Ig domain
MASNAGNPLTFTASGLPTGLSIDINTGVISGIATTAGTYSATVTGADAVGASDSETISWTVESSGTVTMTLASTSNLSNVTGDSISLSQSATDSAGHPMDPGCRQHQFASTLSSLVQKNAFSSVPLSALSQGARDLSTAS